MAIKLRKRSRPAWALDDTSKAEHAAMKTLAQTLQRLSDDLPPGSPLAAEFSDIARCIDVTGVMGTWRLESAVREFAESEAA